MKIAVIEDHQLIRDMLVLTCGNVVPGAAVDGAATGREGVARCREGQPDVVFLDLALPDGDGLDFVKEIFGVAPHTKIIALTSHTDEFTIHRALRGQVHGFVDKNEQPLDVLKEAIAAVMSGRQYLSATARRIRLAMRLDPADFSKLLSDREMELLPLLGEALSNEEIAARTGLAAGTVKLHRNKIMMKLGVHSTPQLMRYALEKGFIRPRTSRVATAS